jgi:hypothetical protein
MRELETGIRASSGFGFLPTPNFYSVAKPFTPGQLLLAICYLPAPHIPNEPSAVLR